MSTNSKDNVSTSEKSMLNSLEERSKIKPIEEVNVVLQTVNEECGVADGSNGILGLLNLKSAEQENVTKNQVYVPDNNNDVSEVMYQPKSKKPKRNKHGSSSSEINISRGEHSNGHVSTMESQNRMIGENVKESSLSDKETILLSILKDISEVLKKNKRLILTFPPHMRNTIWSLTSQDFMMKMFETMKSILNEDEKVDELLEKLTSTSGQDEEDDPYKVTVNEKDDSKGEQVNLLFEIAHYNIMKSCNIITAEKILQNNRHSRLKENKVLANLASFILKYLY